MIRPGPRPGDGGNQFASDFTTGVVHGVNIKIRLTVFDSRGQHPERPARLSHPRPRGRGHCKTKVQETKGLIVCAGGYPQRELGIGPGSSKGRHCGGDADVLVGAGRRWQQWMCAALSGDVRPLNVALISIVLAVVSRTTVTKPIPAGLMGGFVICTRKVPLRRSSGPRGQLVRAGLPRPPTPVSQKQLKYG